MSVGVDPGIAVAGSRKLIIYDVSGKTNSGIVTISQVYIRTISSSSLRTNSKIIYLNLDLFLL